MATAEFRASGVLAVVVCIASIDRILARVGERVRLRPLVRRIVALLHVAEFLRSNVDAPELVRAGNELALCVPAIHPCDAIVELEEADLNHFAARVLDIAVLFTQVVVRTEKIAFENFGIPDRRRWNHLDHVFVRFLFHRCYRTSLVGLDFSGAGGFLVGGDEVPPSARNVLISTRNRGLPVFRLPGRPLGLVLAEPFLRLEKGLRRDEQIRCHPKDQTVTSSKRLEPSKEVMCCLWIRKLRIRESGR